MLFSFMSHDKSTFYFSYSMSNQLFTCLNIPESILGKFAVFLGNGSSLAIEH